jgi:hypothetical protein
MEGLQTHPCCDKLALNYLGSPASVLSPISGWGFGFFIHWRVVAERRGGAGDFILGLYFDRRRHWPSSGVGFAATGRRAGLGGSPASVLSPISGWGFGFFIHWRVVAERRGGAGDLEK